MKKFPLMNRDSFCFLFFFCPLIGLTSSLTALAAVNVLRSVVLPFPISFR